MLLKPDEEGSGRRCNVVGTGNRDVLLKLQWLLFNVADDDVSAALAPYSKVLDVSRELWLIDGCHRVSTHHDADGGVTPEATMSCASPRTAHIRRDCRILKRNVCRRFGHDGTQCLMTYAVAVGPVGGEEKSELLMVEADAKEAIAGPDAGAVQTPNASAPPKGAMASSAANVSPGTWDGEPSRLLSFSPLRRRGLESRQQARGAPMQTAVSLEVATKRTRDDHGADAKVATKEEPPAKTAPIRWSRPGAAQDMLLQLQDVLLKLKWLLFNVANDDMSAALAPNSKVLDVSRERWLIDGCHRRTARIRKECRILKLNVCRRFGHDGTQCVMTYAVAVGPVGSEEKSELLMVEADAKEDIAGPDAGAVQTPNATAPPKGAMASSTANVAPGTWDGEPSRLRPFSPLRRRGLESRQQARGAPIETAVTLEVATKRTRDDHGADAKVATKEEPPAKTAPIRWSRPGAAQDMLLQVQ
ncbi:uncharacterized protein ISCGN_022457 [Ixodes scapularis]